MGAAVSDIINVPYAVECKRTTRYQLRRAWIEQARRQGKNEHRPWLLVIAEHGDRNPICVCDFRTFLAKNGRNWEQQLVIYDQEKENE